MDDERMYMIIFTLLSLNYGTEGVTIHKDLTSIPLCSLNLFLPVYGLALSPDAHCISAFKLKIPRDSCSRQSCGLQWNGIVYRSESTLYHLI